MSDDEDDKIRKRKRGLNYDDNPSDDDGGGNDDSRGGGAARSGDKGKQSQRRGGEDNDDDDDDGAGTTSAASGPAKRFKSGYGQAHVEDENLDTMSKARRARVSRMQAGDLKDNDTTDRAGADVGSDEEDGGGERLEAVDGEEEGKEWNEDGDYVEPFNLEQERTDGYFDESGNYVENNDRDVEKDVFAAELDAIYEHGGAPKISKATMERIRKEEELRKVPVADKDPIPLKTELVALLHPRENALAALRRVKDDKVAFARITEIADVLLSQGDYNIYEFTREDLGESLKRRPSIRAGAGQQWEYRWGGEEADVHGPYTTEQMREWLEYFDDKAPSVRVVVGEKKAKWVSYTDVNFK